MPEPLSVLQELVAKETPEDLWQALSDAMAQYGFDRLAYGLARTDNTRIHPDDQDLVFFSNHESIAGSFSRDVDFFMRTPMFRWSLHHIGACSWAWAEAERAAGRLSEDEIRCMEHRRKQGFVAGYSLSFVDPSLHGRAMLTLAARPGLNQEAVDAIWRQSGGAIELICQVMHLKMRCLPLPVRRRPLSPRQREALSWVAAGKTTQDIATIMGVSPAMVEKHLKLVRETLDVGTTAHAVAKAAMLNHLFTVIKNTLPDTDAS